MGKTVRISNSNLNSYGTRVLTTGVDMEQYKRNPIILWMHNRAFRGTTDEVLPIGNMTNIRIEGDDILGEVELKATTDFEKTIAEKWENGTLRMVSPWFDVIAVDESLDLALPGQTRATVTKAKLVEISIVDIGGGDDNLQLAYNGKQLKLTEGGDCPDIPALHINNSNKDKEEMELKTIALAFGLKDSATEADVLALAAGMQAKDNKITELQSQLDSLKLAGITGKVEAAIAEGRLPADKKDSMIALGKMDATKLDEVLALMQKPLKPTDIIGGGASAGAATGASLELSKATKLSEIPSAQWGELREKDLPLYKKLYKGEYGIECNIE